VVSLEGTGRPLPGVVVRVAMEVNRTRAATRGQATATGKGRYPPGTIAGSRYVVNALIRPSGAKVSTDRPWVRNAPTRGHGAGRSP
jgi:hypothetical protein